MSARKIASIPLVLLLFLLTSSAGWAQFTQRGTITGVVTDPSGAVIPGANVTLTDLDRNQTLETVTGDEGTYTFANVTPGRYQVSVEMPGFSKSVSDQINLASQQTLRVDMALQVGEMSEIVEVRGTAPLLKSEQGSVGQVVDRAFVESLPTKGRNFTAFVALAPNISTFPRGNWGGTWAVGGHHVIGGLDYVVGGGGNNGFYMNGVNVNENWVGGLSYAPSVEAVAEVKVDVAGFSAENGRDISTLNVMTRGGTNQYHGAIFDYLQNDNLNALNSFDKAMGATSGAFLQRNQFGANFGGPVRIPKLFDGSDRLFFFVNFEGTRENRGGENAIYRVPTDEELQGDFSHLLRRFPGDPYYVIYNPFSTVINEDGDSIREPIPNNDLRNVPGLINPFAREMLEGLFPRPSGYTNPADPDDLRNHLTFQSWANNNYRIDARVDFKITENDNLFVNVSRSHGMDDNKGGLFPDLNLNVEDSSTLVTANYAKTITPTLTNEFIFAVGKGRMYNVDQAAIDYMSRSDTLRNKYFKNLGVGDDYGLYAMEIAGIGTLGSWETFMSSNPTLQLSDNINLLRGRHTVKAGFNYFRKEQRDWDVFRGVVFDNQFTRAGSVDNSIGGDSLAGFLVGIPSYMRQKYQLTGGDDDLYFRMPYWGFFVEDKFQVNPKLTISAGLRYDLSIPTFSPNKYGNAVMDFDYPGWQLKIPGRAPGLNLHYLPADKNNFAPRISIAYRPTSDLIVRTSYGIFYDLGTTVVGGDRMGEAFNSVPGYVGSDYANWSIGVHDDIPHFTFDDVFPEALSFPVGNYPISTGPGSGYFDWMASPYYSDLESEVTPMYHRYMLEIQKGLGEDMVVSVSYFGGRGMKLPYWESQNQPAYRTGWPSDDAFNEARPNNNGRFADPWVLRHGLNSFYNAGTVKVERRMSSGLQFVSHYTFSKTVQDRSYRYHRWLGRGEANFSHPHRFFSAVTWDVPWGNSLPKAAQYALAGWRLTLMTTFESGNAETVWNWATSARDMEPDRPNVSGNPNLSRSERNMIRYFNTGVFSAPPQDVKGNAGEGIVRGPGVNNWDMSLTKTFRITEKVNADLRGEFFNLFNHT
ncbi:MAG TPA: TonB-dependent receptor, partial [Acidobacteriota bacterium]|nr:TonB-dependent receptor [Acidobacteriota bacterium]